MDHFVNRGRHEHDKCQGVVVVGPARRRKKKHRRENEKQEKTTPWHCRHDKDRTKKHGLCVPATAPTDAGRALFASPGPLVCRLGEGAVLVVREGTGYDS